MMVEKKIDIVYYFIPVAHGNHLSITLKLSCQVFCSSFHPVSYIITSLIDWVGWSTMASSTEVDFMSSIPFKEADCASMPTANFMHWSEEFKLVENQCISCQETTLC